MDVLAGTEISQILQASNLVRKYNQDVDSESAYEILTAKLQAAATVTDVDETRKNAKPEPTVFDKIAKNSVVKSLARTGGNIIVRSLLGALGFNGRASRRKSNWF